MTFWLMAWGGDDEVARHRPVLITAPEHFARLEEQVTLGIVDQPNPFGDTRLRDDDLARSTGVIKGDELDRWGRGLKPVMPGEVTNTKR